MRALPKIPWQLTGNHWISVPCIHPADGSIHAVGVVQRSLRGAIEFAGGSDFVDGGDPALIRLGITVDGTPVDLPASRMAWQRVSEWLPTFNATAGDVVVRGTVFAPVGRDAEAPGFVYVLSFENRGEREVEVEWAPQGVLGVRQHRIVSARPLDDAHAFVVGEESLTLTGASATPGGALALAVDGARPHAERQGDGTIAWSLTQQLRVSRGARVEVALYVAAGPERDGAASALEMMRRHGWRALAETTRSVLRTLEQGTGVQSADRLVNRHLMFAYFYGVARAIDDAQLYLVRSRAPWHPYGMTIRDWDALMWTIPAIQIADADLARELILRMCEVHGYAPGRGVNYLDGAPFRMEFSLAAVAAYALAVDRYIAQTADDRIVEEAALADTLYGAHDDIVARRHTSIPLYSTEVTPSGLVAELPYTLHANAVVAHALDVFRQTLDEKTADTVEQGDVVRAALLRHFAVERDTSHTFLAAAADLNGAVGVVDDPVGSAYWLPLYETLSRDDSTYRRTVRRLAPPDPPTYVAFECAQLLGPEGAAVLDRLRRATMDNGVAAERLDEQGLAVGNGGDAGLSGLIAYAVWYAVHALGVRI